MGFEPPTLNLFEKLRARERAAARPARTSTGRARSTTASPESPVRPPPPTRLSARRTHNTTHRRDLPGAPRAEPAATRFVPRVLGIGRAGVSPSPTSPVAHLPLPSVTRARKRLAARKKKKGGRRVRRRRRAACTVLRRRAVPDACFSRNQHDLVVYRFKGFGAADESAADEPGRAAGPAPPRAARPAPGALGSEAHPVAPPPRRARACGETARVAQPRRRATDTSTCCTRARSPWTPTCSRATSP